MTSQSVSQTAELPFPDLQLAESLFAELAQRTGNEEGITRMSYGLGEQIAHDLLRREARAIGLSVHKDAACNLYITLEGQSGAPGIYLGSHVDSVPRGGNFDGAAGVLAGLAVVSGFRKAGRLPPRNITVMAIRAEESTWFNASYIGSRAALGKLLPEELENVTRSNDGITLGAAISAAGGDVASLAQQRSCVDLAQIGMFVEPHIEQGPLLLARDIPLGIVTGIRGSFRYRRAACIGVYAHSGATPRSERQDALCAVATFIVEMNQMWSRRESAGDDLTVTFGQIATDPEEAAFSKVPGHVTFALDVRSESLETLAAVREEMKAMVARISQQQRVRFELGPETSSQPAVMDPSVIAALGSAARTEAIPVITMPSGAGHDAAVFAQAGVPTTMLFLRNTNGSHNPQEQMDMDDFAQAAQLLSRLCLEFGA